MPTLNNKSFSTLCKWFYKFLRRNNYTLRRMTHIGQGPKKEAFDQLMNFLKVIINIRKELQILENLNSIGNLDETPIFFEMYNNYTVSKIGEKTVKVKNFGYEKDRISVVLCITSNGKKLPPLIVFKGKPEGTIFKNLKKTISRKKIKFSLHVNLKVGGLKKYFMIGSTKYGSGLPL